MGCPLPSLQPLQSPPSNAPWGIQDGEAGPQRIAARAALDLLEL